MIIWYENTGDGSAWGTHVISSTALGPKSVFAADLDKDGDMDVLSASYADSKIAWYENKKGESGDWKDSWLSYTITTSAIQAHCVHASDLDNDGDFDVISAAYNGNEIAWYENLYSQPPLSCSGFEPPMENYPVTVKGKNAALPLKAQLFDSENNLITDFDLEAAPVLQVIFTPSQGGEPLDVSDQALPAGQGTEGNQFVFTDEGKWQYNLKTKNYSAPGTYTITMVSGDESEYKIEPTCETSFVVPD